MGSIERGRERGRRREWKRDWCLILIRLILYEEVETLEETHLSVRLSVGSSVCMSVCICQVFDVPRSYNWDSVAYDYEISLLFDQRNNRLAKLTKQWPSTPRRSQAV